MRNKIISWFKQTTPPDAVRWSQTYDIGPLKQRLAGLDKTDPLYPLLLGFLDAQIVALADAKVSADAAQQFVGRQNMCADLKQELRSLWLQSHTPPK